MTAASKSRCLFESHLVRQALLDAFRKLDPRRQVRNPVMFTVLVGSLLTTVLGLRTLLVGGQESAGFVLGISAWLWFTVLFANFAEALAEGRGKAQAHSLRKIRARCSGQATRRTESYLGVSTDPGLSTK